jgi:hypothetical protein
MLVPFHSVGHHVISTTRPGGRSVSAPFLLPLVFRMLLQPAAGSVSSSSCGLCLPGFHQPVRRLTHPPHLGTCGRRDHWMAGHLGTTVSVLHASGVGPRSSDNLLSFRSELTTASVLLLPGFHPLMSISTWTIVTPSVRLWSVTSNTLGRAALRVVVASIQCGATHRDTLPCHLRVLPPALHFCSFYYTGVIMGICIVFYSIPFSKRLSPPEVRFSAPPPYS